MTNQLFRDYLDEDVPMPVRPKSAKGGVWVAPVGTPLNLSNMTGWMEVHGIAIEPWQAEFIQQMNTTPRRYIFEPTDPRAHALTARQHRGTGPAPEPLRMRGRTNRYKEKP
ncbi:hypothetical protein [Arthrobacter sp. GMC3]|uniref:hypothetical protein n=1 Tax=Arthrobacter sp. GMC3 TaxID=2058894 RepID=UPI000CE2CD3B|nr:hypothetical protein [Arthrobacter sp. GMC3]